LVSFSGQRPDRAQAPQRAACARCGAAFDCDPGGDCWCAHEDFRLPMPVAGETCLCVACLRAAAQDGPRSDAPARPAQFGVPPE